MLDSLNCRFVTSDMFTFRDDFNSDIFTGSSQFAVENYFYSEEQKKLLFKGEEIDLIRQPLHRSCFVSLQKKRYQIFCTTCKRAYNDLFEKQLHVFSRIYKNE